MQMPKTAAPIGAIFAIAVGALSATASAVANTLPADRVTTTPDQENVITYHGVQGFQLDTKEASVSGARRMLVTRKRVGERSATLIDYGNGVGLTGINGDLNVTPRRRTRGEQNRYGHNYRSKTLAGSDPVVEKFNQLLSKRLRAASGQPGNATWTTSFQLSELVDGLRSDAKLTLEVEREFARHDEQDYVLIGYSVPAFAYQDAAANNIIHWASGFIVTDPEYSIVYYYGAKNSGTRNAATPDASPLSARLFSFATNDKGERLLDISQFEAANALIDQAVAGATDYMDTSRDSAAKAFFDTGFFALSRMIDMAASAVGENSGNQATEHSDGGWDQAENVGNIATRAAQGNNALSVFRAVSNLGGTAYTKEFLKDFDNILEKVYDGESTKGWSELWTDTKSSGHKYVSGFLEHAKENGLVVDEISNWVADAKNGVISTEGVGSYLFRIFGETPKEALESLARIGIHSADGVAKIAGPLAWAASGYTIAQGFVPQDPTAPNPELIGSARTDYGVVIGDTFVLSGAQFFDRVILDVGAGLYLDLKTGDLIGFGLDVGAVVVKSFADTAEAYTYYRNAVKEVEFTEATFFELAATDYKRSKPYVDANLPLLLSAESNRTGQDWSWLIDADSVATDRDDWEALQNNPRVLFTWEIVDATGSMSYTAANKITRNNFHRAMLNWLEKRNPDTLEDLPGDKITYVLPPEDQPELPGDAGPQDPTGPDPDGDPIRTGTVTTGTALTRSDTDPGKTGEVTTSLANRPTANVESIAPEPKDEWHDPRDGWHNENRYDQDGDWVGYTPTYPLAKPRETLEDTGYEGLFSDVVEASERAAAEEAALAKRLKDPYSAESIAKRKKEAQDKLDAQYDAAHKAAGLPEVDNFDTAEERQAYYQGQLDAQYKADREAKGLPEIDNFKTSAERQAYYRGQQNAELEADRFFKGLPPLDTFKSAEERNAYYSGVLQEQYEERREDQGLPPLDEFDSAAARDAYYQGQLDKQYEQNRSDAGLPPLDQFKTAVEREAYYQARNDAKQAEAAEDLPPLDNFDTAEERAAAYQAWLEEAQKREEESDDKTDADDADDAADSEDAEALAESDQTKDRLLRISPLPGGDYPNQVDYGDGSYPEQAPIDWSKFDTLGNYPNPIDYGDGSYPNPVTIDWSKWDTQANYPNQLPNDWFQTPYDGDSFAKFTRNNAFKYGNMFGMIPTNLPAYDEFIAYYGLEHLNGLARNAGYPNIFAALEDQDYLIALSKNPGFRTRALNFECNVRFGVNYDCIGLNRQERGQLELGELLQESSAFASDGFSDVSISGLLLSVFLRDFGLEDGDVVNLMVSQFGQTLISRDISLTNAGTRESTRVRRGVVEVTVTALNTGEIPPNTAAVVIENVAKGDAEQDFGQETGGSSSLKVEVGGG